MTNSQAISAAEFIADWELDAEKRIFHHGDCVGVDVQLAKFARSCGYYIVSHPPIIRTYRAFSDANITYDPKPYMERNEAIVVHSDLLLVVPDGPEESNPRSGTWATYRLAIKYGVPVEVIMP
jgi:hypothetical protein